MSKRKPVESAPGPVPASTQTPVRHDHKIAPGLLGLACPIGDLRTDPKNARAHPRKSIEAICASLRRFGQQKPVVSVGGVVIAGNGTLVAARELGWTHIAVVQSELESAEAVAYAIADNRTGELSDWDNDVLGAALSGLEPEAVLAAGFTQDDMVKFGFAKPESMEDDDPQAVAQVAVSQTGDLWLLDGHRLLNGDSTDPECVSRLMDGAKAALVSTDPPYLVDYTGSRPSKEPGKEGGKDWTSIYDELSFGDAERFYTALFTNVLRVIGEKAPIYCWHSHKRVGLIQSVWARLGILDHQQIVWVKPGAVMGRSFWHFQHEPCMMGWVQGSMPEHDGRRVASSVWRLPVPALPADDPEASDVWFADWEGKARIVGNEHPTQKPLEIFARPMRKHTKAGDVVFEPFSGSGSQLVAAERLGRRCYAIEMQPVFVDVAIRRWQAETGREAVLACADGDRTWAQVAAARSVSLDSKGKPCPSKPLTRALEPDVPGSPTEGTAIATHPKNLTKKRSRRT